MNVVQRQTRIKKNVCTSTLMKAVRMNEFTSVLLVGYVSNPSKTRGGVIMT